MLSNVPPGIWMLLAPLVALLPRYRARQVGFVALPLVSLLHLMFAVPEGTIVHLDWMDLSLTVIRADRIALIWGYVFHLAAILSAIYAVHRRDVITQVMGLIYAGSAIAAVFAGDLLTLFLFWELTAVSSVFLVWAGRTPESYAAGFRYLIVQVASGVLLLSAALFLLSSTGQMGFGGLGQVGVFREQTGQLFGVCLLFAFGIKAAFPLLHCWLPDAYPEAPPDGTVYLSAFTTKLAVYALLRGFAGWEPLIGVGCVMALVPLIYAAVADDMRRCLAHCLNNQLGFMVVAVGVGSPLAINGAAAHAVAHIVYKGLLFMAAGAILFRTGTARTTQLGGLAREMPWTFACYLVGVAAISAPLFSGFVTKSLTLSAVADGHHHAAWLCLLAATAGVFWVCGPRLVYQVFLRSGRQTSLGEPVPANMRMAMLLAAVICLLIGLFPIVLYRWLPFDLAYRPYTVPHVVGQLQLMVLAVVAFGLCQRLTLITYRPGQRLLDVDWFYRRPLPRLIGVLADGLAAGNRWASAAFTRLAAVWIRNVHNRVSDVGARGALSGTGQMAMWSAIMLILYLLLYFR